MSTQHVLYICTTVKHFSSQCIVYNELKERLSVKCAATQGRESRMGTSAIHPGQPCQECSLCKKRGLSKYTHPKSWKDPSLLQVLQTTEPSLALQPESCICVALESRFSPRWRKGTGINPFTGAGAILRPTGSDLLISITLF